MAASLKSVNMKGIRIGQASAPPAVYVLDTFGGSAGELGSHTGEVGATWSDDGNGGGGVDFTDLLISGSNSAYLDYLGATPATAGQQSAKTSGGVPNDLSNFYLEYTANIDTSQIQNDGGVVAYVNDGYSNNDYGINMIYATFSTDGHAPYDYLLQVLFQAFTTTDTLTSSNITVASGSHTLRVEVTNSRKTFNFFLDTVNVFSGTNPTSLDPLTATGFWINSMSSPDTNTQAVKITSFSVGAL